MATHPMHDRTVVLTGGNSGIGLETAVGLASAGARVVMGCRNEATAAEAVEEVRRRSGNDAVESRRLDLADLASVRAFADSLCDLDAIDVLVNNAGLMLDERRETTQGFEAVFGTDHLGHFLLTNLLLEQVRAAGRARIVVVASEAHRMARRGIEWGDLDRHGHYRPWSVYGEAKLANILHARALAARLEGTGVVAHSLHPGSVRTNFGRQGDTSGMLATVMDIGNPLLLSPAEGALTSIHVATAPDAGATTGLYWRRRKPATPSRAARDRRAAEHLWVASERMVAAAG